MGSLFNFFRVFDIAFFAPGTLLFAAWYYARAVDEFAAAPAPAKPAVSPAPLNEVKATVEGTSTFTLSAGSSPSGSVVDGVVSLLVVIGIIYALGLLTHALREKYWPKVAGESSKKQSWYATFPEKDTGKGEIALYFWYLRGTCWNIAFVLPMVPLVIALRYVVDFRFRPELIDTKSVATVLIAAVVVFIFVRLLLAPPLRELGDHFDKSLGRISGRDQETP